MKFFRTLTWCFMALVLLQRCSNDDPEKNSSTVTFTLSTSTSSDGRQQAIAIEGVSKVLLSVETNTGEPVFTHRLINLLTIGNGFITEPVELEVGAYKITDFLLVDGDNEAHYAVPLKDSPLGGFVKYPLPYSFSVAKNKVASVEMQVISTDEQSPEDFGYASFAVAEIKPFQLSVFIQEDGKTKLTSATAHLVQNHEVVHTYSLKATVNKLGFTHDPEMTYTLAVIKDGFVPYYKSFTYSELGGASGSPIQVFLQPAFTIRTHLEWNPESDHRFGLYMGSFSEMTLTIDWGDSTQSTQHFYGGPFSGEILFHSYADSDKNYFITITGPLDQVDWFYTDPERDFVRFGTVETRHLINLTNVGFFAHAPEHLDLSRNFNLERIDINSTEAKKITLPAHHKISWFDLTRAVTLAPSLDSYIDNIHRNAVANNIKNGRVFYSLDHNGPNQYEPIGPISDESIQKLDELAMYYQWQIVPYW